jgi:hypothetical protein
MKTLTADMGTVYYSVITIFVINATPTITVAIIMGGRSTDSHDMDGLDPLLGGDSTSISSFSVSGLRRGER